MRARLINEYNFTRGLDPKEAMGIGDVRAQAKKILKPVFNIIKDLKKNDIGSQFKDANGRVIKLKNISEISFHSGGYVSDMYRGKFTEVEQFYIEFRYYDSWCSIGLASDNDVIITRNDSSDKIRDKIIDWMRRK